MSRAGAGRVYPLLFRPILKEKVWGGTQLRQLGKRAPSGAKIGESWEVADLSSTDPQGGGGAEERSVIDVGPLQGKTLRDAMALWGADLLGDAAPAADGGFPLLVKLLDADENLSVQTHPSAAYARAHPGAHLKTESWYVLRALPGAVIYKGLAQSASREALRAAARDGSIVSMLRAVPARAGDCYNLPSGVVHALGAGVTVAEVQTPSDTTFRLYDWGRASRALHIEQAIECATLTADDAPPARHDGAGRNRLIDAGAFTMDLVRLAPGQACAPADAQRCAIWLVVEGVCELRADEMDAKLQPGATALIPAASTATARCIAGEAGAGVLEMAPAVQAPRSTL